MGTHTLFLFFLFFFLVTGSTFASGGAARTDTVAAGAYIIAVQFSQDPPYVDAPLTLTIVPRQSQQISSGTLIAQPGAGTDATPLHVALAPVGDNLQGTLHLPVRGAWRIQIQLDGVQGSGAAHVDVVVGAPGAMPSWLAWLIGSAPLVLVSIWLVSQHRYRRQLVEQGGPTAIINDGPHALMQ
ncbi:hypothetical protein [Tengunoibacter tsumagoiensis]|uniref:YtkA-like domain-containing protein n=1 Tax=Tengunoibacter tsumagoiensis TaxID=2014871 RepID=A0A402A3D7_9CHLR|nr:hypothetical protein [Tengunoibacter tsumagoiensis]GCE13654.1 hypothetical protein KTT_35130 [Tengunoibacter tsumagoiensis]